MPTKIGIGPLKRASKNLQIKKKRERNTDSESITAKLIENSLKSEKKNVPEQLNEIEGQLSIDVIISEEEIIIIAPIAGVESKNIQISLLGERLIIYGTRNYPLEAKGENFITQECFFGNFSREIVLPEKVDRSKIKATFKNGILKINIARTDREKTHMIKINS